VFQGEDELLDALSEVLLVRASQQLRHHLRVEKLITFMKHVSHAGPFI